MNFHRCTVFTLLLVVISALTGSGYSTDAMQWPHSTFNKQTNFKFTGRTLTLEQARSLYQTRIDWGPTVEVQQARLKAASRIEELIGRYLSTDRPVDSRQRKVILNMLNSAKAPFSVYEEILIFGGVKKEGKEVKRSWKFTIKKFEPVLSDPFKDQPPEVSFTVQLPDDYSPYKQYPVVFSGTPAGVGDVPHIKVTYPYSDAELGNPLLWRGRVKLNALFTTLHKHFAIDPDRVIATGYSFFGKTAVRWGLFQSDRYAAVSGHSAVPPLSLDLPFLRNYKPMPVALLHNGHTGTPMKIVTAFEKEAKRIKVNLSLRSNMKNAAGDSEADQKWFANWITETLRTSRRNLYRKTLSFANNDQQVNRRAWIRIDQYERRGNPALKFRIRYPKIMQGSKFKAPASGFIELKNLLIHPATVEARIENNTISLKTRYARGVTVFLSNRMLDMTKPVTFVVNGRRRMSKKYQPALFFMLEEARKSGRRDRAYSASQTLRAP